MRLAHRSLLLLITLGLVHPALGAAAPASVSGAVVEHFLSDPMTDPGTRLEGAAFERAAWQHDRPAYPGDRPGSLTVLYDARLEAGRIGFLLPRPFTQDDPFTAAAVLVLHSEGLIADPDGFFQISWGLWNDGNTGLERTGSFTDFAGDTFEMAEFAYFPNVSTFFGGPFLSPTLFGAADPDDPLLDLLGSFSNLSFASLELALPLDEPLLALMEHHPADDVLVVSVHRIGAGGRPLPLDGGVLSIPLDLLPHREFSLDTVGLTLWRDGFAGEAPSLVARVTYHALIAAPVLLDRPERILHVPPTRP
jgi:hypothetical protein